MAAAVVAGVEQCSSFYRFLIAGRQGKWEARSGGAI
jgi:hypothetical protein